MLNPVVEHCRQVRDNLVKECGGLDGLFDKLEALDRARLRAAVARKNKKPRKPAAGRKPTRSKRSK